MSILEDYEKTFGLDPFEPAGVLALIESAEEHMDGCTKAQIRTTGADADRLPIWLAERLQAVYAALEHPRAPVEHRCGWCWRAAGATEEAWHALPKMDLEAIQAHAQMCEHCPLVRVHRAATERIRVLEATLADLQGRKLGNGDAWAEAASESLGMYEHMRGLHEAMKATIRALLATEQPAGELRRAIGELVK